MLLGSKPLRQIDGTVLSDGHIAANSTGVLIYEGVGAGYFTVSGGARGIQGLQGPPDGTFSLRASDGHLIFQDTNGITLADLDAIAFRYRGVYAAGTTYGFLDVVLSSGALYWHHARTETTGVAPTVAATWSSAIVPGLATVATSGAYGDLSGRPNLAAVALLRSVYRPVRNADHPERYTCRASTTRS